ncbi:MAG: phosphotransferase [Candidatus Vogelbacteria bacterium]|nr:phosphotransferase [Candidatus Vogelbacteria bacterium]
MEATKFIEVEGKKFEFVKTRTYTDFSIYKSGDLYLRIGPKDIVTSELSFHKNLLELDFPVAKIVSEGELGGKFYYIETSQGNNLLGKIFADDFKKFDYVREPNFDLLLDISKRFARAQLKTVKKEKNYESFYIGVHVDYIIDELPGLKDKVLQAFAKVKERTFLLPTVVTHGDFNPFNLLERGVIDFGNNFEGIAGYDLVSNIYQTYFFPNEDGFEYQRRYEFTPGQVGRYFDSLNIIYIEAGLPRLSSFLSEFILMRAIWSAVRMRQTPKLQAWRYKNFELLLSAYLKDEDISKIIIDM